MDEKMFANLMATQKEQALQLENIGQIILKNIETETLNNLRDFLLIKLIISELADSEGVVKKRMRQRLDTILFNIGDEKLMCEAIAQAHLAIEGAK